MNDSPMLRALSAIQATVHQHLALNQGQPFQHAPSFDTHTAYTPLKSALSELSSQLSSIGLSVEVAAEINNVLTAESHSYQTSIAHSRQQLLDDLSRTTVSSDPLGLPSLVTASCQKFYNANVDSCMDSVRKHLSEYTNVDGPLSDPEELSESEENSSYQSEEEEEEEEDGIDGQDAEEDDNTPMKAGEEVPPLETKYLPIFEALHERGKVLTKPEKTYLVNMTGMTYRQITIWFQNRRRGELKEDANRVLVSRAESVHSFSSSDNSDELNLERHLSNNRSNTTFDICSWRLTSAFPTKEGIAGSSVPPSPTKLSFMPTMATESDTDDTDLSDSGDDTLVPPGLQDPSLSMSTTATSVGVESIQHTSNIAEPLIVSATTSSVGRPASTRPVKSLPNSRLSASPTSINPTQAQIPSSFVGGTTQPIPTSLIGRYSAAPAVPLLQPVSSNERGLTVQVNAVSQASTMTLPSFSSTTPPTRSPDSSLPSPSNSTSVSPQRNTSPTPSVHSASSPRPPVKPLPRRTGCAPRPRPPPRPTPSAVATSTTTSSSARASVVLPPSSNPSLGNTTLGSLLRPNQPVPRIPLEMEERLAAMAGRMGVGKDTNTTSGAKQTINVAPTVARSSFSFGPTSLPRLNAPLGSAPTFAPSQASQNSSGPSQP